MLRCDGQTAEEATELASYKHLYSYGQTVAEEREEASYKHLAILV